MTPEEHETLAALETENADLRSEVSRLRNIAAERDALADEVAALQTRMLEKIRFGHDAAARVSELEDQVKGLIECLEERKSEVDRYRRPERDHFDRG